MQEIRLPVRPDSTSGHQYGTEQFKATKAGVTEMTLTWPKEMARYGIRVGAIAPGYINTEVVAVIREEMKQNIIEQIPSRTLGETSEIGHSDSTSWKMTISQEELSSAMAD